MISVIVPVYNLEKYISRTLDSILAQTYQNIEIIVVNDGSDDGTKEILDDYAIRYTNRIIVIHIQNGGVTNARLTGVKHASGEWIGFVDGDDVIDPDMYQRLMSNSIRYDADISHCGYQMVFDDGRIRYFHNTGEIKKQDTETGLKDLLEGIVVEPGLCNKLFKRKLFDKLMFNDIMPLNIKINEDLLMNYYLFSDAELSVYEDFCPYHYIVRAGSASRTKMNRNKIYDPICVKELIRQLGIEGMWQETQRAYMSTCIDVYHSLIVAGSDYEDDICEVRKLLRKEHEQFGLMGKKRSKIAKCIISAPTLYNLIYKIYNRFLKKDDYS